MKTIVSNKQNWFNKIKLTKDDKVYVGIDVHKKSYANAVWLNDAPAIDFVMPADNQKVLTMLDKLRIALKQVVYEAGPTGYSLARLLGDAKLPIRVIAPSKTPRQSARESKTDKLDCRKLDCCTTPAKRTRLSLPWPDDWLFIYGKCSLTINRLYRLRNNYNLKNMKKAVQ